MGSIAAEAKYLRDETGVKGVFFLFNDLSIRTSGTYRLRFTLFEAIPYLGLIQAFNEIRVFGDCV
jgi:Velvet factor